MRALKNTTVDDCRIIDLPRFQLPEGSISVVEELQNVPFPIARVFYLYDVPGGESRGGHAHHELEQLIISCLGSFDVVIDDGHRRRTISLNRSFYGLYLPPGIWAELMNFSSGAISLVLTSLPFDEADYVRDHAQFVQLKTV
jgi:hypothetical protein